MISPQPNLITRRTGRLLSAWALTITLSGMGGPTKRNKYPISIALRFTETHKHLHHDKIAVTHGEGLNLLLDYNNLILGRAVQKSINTNPGLKVDRRFNFSCVKVFTCLCFVEFEISRLQNWRTENMNQKPR